MRFPETMWANFENPLLVSFSSRGEKVAIKNGLSHILVHDVLSGDLIKDLAHEGEHGIQGQALSPDGNTLAYATRKRPYIKIYDLLGDRPLTTLKGHNMVLYQMSFSPDGKRLVSSSIGYSPLILWDTKKWSQVASLPISPGSVNPVARFSQSSDNLIIYESLLDSKTQNIRILRAPSLAEIKNYKKATSQ
jgi:WD40 repeat protein